MHKTMIKRNTSRSQHRGSACQAVWQSHESKKQGPRVWGRPRCLEFAGQSTGGRAQSQEHRSAWWVPRVLGLLLICAEWLSMGKYFPESSRPNSTLSHTGLWSLVPPTRVGKLSNIPRNGWTPQKEICLSWGTNSALKSVLVTLTKIKVKPQNTQQTTNNLAVYSQLTPTLKEYNEAESK